VPSIYSAMITCHKRFLEDRCIERGYLLSEVMSCVVRQEADIWTIDEGHSAYPREKITSLSFTCLPDCNTPEFACSTGYCCTEDPKTGGNDCLPCSSSSSSEFKQPALLWACGESKCIQVQGDLCNLNKTNPCPFEWDSCGSDHPATFTTTGDGPSEPSALVCCSDIGAAFGFSQRLLDEQDWSLEWCEDYNQQNCGSIPVNDFNRCRYLMFLYGPTEAGDYCDRIDLYINNQYDVGNLPGNC
jgi:hypothetical protein